MNNDILLIGANGYIGSCFKNNIPEENLTCLSYKDLSVQALLNQWACKPFSFIINCSGSWFRHRSEEAEGIYHNINAPIILTEFVNIVKNITILHVSCSDVYNAAHSVCDEGSEKDYLEPFACSKNVAEEIVTRYPNHYICRAAPVFDKESHKNNFITKLTKEPSTVDRKISLVNRQEFVQACLHLLYNKHEFGAYNICNSGSINLREVMSYIQKYLKVKLEHVDLFDDPYFWIKLPFGISNEKILQTGVKLSNVHDILKENLEKWK